MRHDVVAFPRRDRVLLAAVISEGVDARGDGVLTLVAEDGARFTFPTALALARFTDPAGPRPDEDPRAWLTRLRSELPALPPWEEIHRRAPPATPLSIDDLASLAGVADGPGRLAIATATSGAYPWFRRAGAAFEAVPREEAEARLRRAEESRQAAEAERALLAWWPRRGAAPIPEACAPAIDALAAFAIRGESPETDRGRVLAAKLDVPEPDQILEALVACGAVPSDVNPAAARAGLDRPFPPQALAQADAAAAAGPDLRGREDLTGLFAAAVDDADTTEVDDAISFRETADGTEILVHIADAAAVIPVGSPLDHAAYARASSLYLPEASVTMLPAPLARARASLEPGAVRETLTGAFRLDAEGRVLAARFTRSTLRIARRLTYEETADPSSLAESPEAARRLLDVCTKLRDARRAAGAVITQLHSLKVSVADGVPHVSVRRQDTPGDLVVAEAMVLFNHEAARSLAAAGWSAFFRVQEPPRAPPPDPADPLHDPRLRRGFAASAIAVDAGRHHGLGVDAYLQATSPLRRFADLVNQRQIAALISGAAPVYTRLQLQGMAAHLLERERAVRRAADDRAAYWLARAHEPLVGTRLPGVLVRPPRRGFGSVWVPSLCRELPLRSPAGWRAPPEGTAGDWLVARVAPWRGRVELEP